MLLMCEAILYAFGAIGCIVGCWRTGKALLKGINTVFNKIDDKIGS